MEAVKAGKEISVKKYVVRLSREEGEQLETLIRKGKGPARRLRQCGARLPSPVLGPGRFSLGWPAGIGATAVPRLKRWAIQLRSEVGSAYSG